MIMVINFYKFIEFGLFLDKTSLLKFKKIYNNMLHIYTFL